MLAAELLESAVDLEKAWRLKRLAFCFIGGIAVQRWGEPRSTRDLDLTLMTGFGQEGPYIDAVLEQFAPRLSDAKEFAILNRVLLVKDQRGTPIDVALGAMPFEQRCVDRASAYHVGDNETITTCSASDLIVHKAFAGRDKDWLDIRGILVRSRESVDWRIVEEEVAPLAALMDDDQLIPRLRSIKSDLEGSGKD